MQRFHFPEQLFRVRNEKNILAYFTFVDNETGLEYRGWRLVQGSKGPFIGPPSDKPYTPEGAAKPVYPDLVCAAYEGKDDAGKIKRNAKGLQFIQDLYQAAFTMYEKKNNGTAAPQTPPQQAQGQTQPARSGAGPVVDDEDAVQLPF